MDSTSSELKKILQRVTQRVSPGQPEREKICSLATRLEKKVAHAASDAGVKAVVRVEGSVAKDTWLSREPDIDVFMRVSPSIPRDSLGEVCLRVARKATKGSRQIERFAEHPYLEAFVDRIRVNIVPCYAVEPGGEWLSATDRTPFHTDYINGKLPDHARSEVRLLKRFMKGIGVYGAEIKIGGFSGYLCELLILHYGSFIQALESFAGYEGKMVLDIENHYRGRRDELQLLFREPLVVIDPIDKARNVASAVRKEKLDNFIAAARAFLEAPKSSYFYPAKTVPFSVRELRERMAERGTEIVFIVFGGLQIVPDVLWGQLYRSQRSLQKLIKLNDFVVLQDLAWSNEKNLSIFIFELEQGRLRLMKKHLGPPLEKRVECDKFLAKHRNNPGTIVGPYIEDGRWVALIRRKNTSAVALLEQKLKNDVKALGIGRKIIDAMQHGFRIIVNDEICEFYEKDPALARFLTDFLRGKPKWLDEFKIEIH